MKRKPYHHSVDGTFRNPKGSPVRDMKFNWSYKIFNKEKKKLDMTIPKNHVIEKTQVIKRGFIGPHFLLEAIFFFYFIDTTVSLHCF